MFESFVKDIWALHMYKIKKKRSFSVLATFLFLYNCSKYGVPPKTSIHFLMLKSLRKDVESKQIVNKWRVNI